MKHLMTMLESHNIHPSIGFQTKTGSTKDKILQPRGVHALALGWELVVFSLMSPKHSFTRPAIASPLSSYRERKIEKKTVPWREWLSVVSVEQSWRSGCNKCNLKVVISPVGFAHTDYSSDLPACYSNVTIIMEVSWIASQYRPFIRFLMLSR